MKYPTSPLTFRPVVLPSPFFRIACRLFVRSFATIPHPNALFSITCSLFSENTRVGVPLSPARPSDLRAFRPADPILPSFVFNILQIPPNPSSTQKPFILIHLQIPFRATPLRSHLYKSPGCYSVLLSIFASRLWSSHFDGA